MKAILFTAKNCPKCPKAKEVFKEVVSELGLEEGKDYQVLNVDEGDNLIEALQYQVASTPSIVVDGEAVFVSTVPEKGELMAVLRD